MLRILMNYMFVLAIGILIGQILAFAIFQRQLTHTMNWYRLLASLKQDYMEYRRIRQK